MRGPVHVIPEHDLFPHDENRGCWCVPEVLDGPVIVHHSADGREKDEPGSRCLAERLKN
jgi:hypothetical protein